MRERIDWNAKGSLEAKLFNLSFEKMIEMIESFNGIDDLIILKADKEKFEDWEKEKNQAVLRKNKRLELIYFRAAFESGMDFPLLGGGVLTHEEVAADLVRKGILGPDWKSDFKHVPRHPNDRSSDPIAFPEKDGLMLCALALAEILTNSEMVREEKTIRYLQNGKLRATVGAIGDTLDGPFEVFCPNGTTWMRGEYENSRIKSKTMKIYQTNGTELKPTPTPDNLVPLFR